MIKEIDRFTNEVDPDLEEVKFHSLTGYYLWIWVHSIENYHDIYQSIKPWSDKLRRTQTGSFDLDEANEKSKRALEKHQDGFYALKETFIKASLEVEAVEKMIEEAE